jgi:hypothetical protein
VLRLRNDGVPILRFTWYSLTDQVDWDTALRETNGRVNAVGLYDLDRNIRPVGKAYQKLIADRCQVLPTRSVCLRVPLVAPHRYQTSWAADERTQARAKRKSTPTESTNTEGGQ